MTIRRYSSKEIDPKLLKRLISEAAKAPTTGNMQLYSVVVTTDPEGKRRLAPAHFNQPQVEGCQAVLTFCADFNRFAKWCQQRGAEPGYDNAQSLACACLDTAAFAQQFELLAEREGLGSCYLGTTTYNPQMIADALGLPKRVVPLITLTVGYPDEEWQDPGRLPVEAVMHAEQYRDYTPADIDRLYADKEAREDSKQFVAENGKETLAQVFTDVRYPRAANEAFSQTLIDFLKKQYPFDHPK